MLTLVANNQAFTESYERYQEAMKNASKRYDTAIAYGMNPDVAGKQLARDMADAWEGRRAGYVARPTLRLV